MPSESESLIGTESTRRINASVSTRASLESNNLLPLQKNDKYQSFATTIGLLNRLRGEQESDIIEVLLRKDITSDKKCHICVSKVSNKKQGTGASNLGGTNPISATLATSWH